MKIYTKTGDKGKTGLLNGKRVYKDHIRVEAYGAVDELNSYIGLARAHIKNKNINQSLLPIQHTLFVIGTNLASTTPTPISELKSNIINLENTIDTFQKMLKPLNNFIIPAGSIETASLHVARVICRRAERRVISLHKKEKIDQSILIYLNRLSDLFFVFARFLNQINNIKDEIWEKP